MLWAFYNFLQVKQVTLQEDSPGEYLDISGDNGGENKVKTMVKIGDLIAEVLSLAHFS